MFYIRDYTTETLSSSLLPTTVVTYVRNPLTLSNSWLYGGVALLSTLDVRALVVFSYPSYPLQLGSILRRFSHSTLYCFAVCAFLHRTGARRLTTRNVEHLCRCDNEEYMQCYRFLRLAK